MATKDYNEILQIIQHTGNNPEVVSCGSYDTSESKHIKRPVSWMLRPVRRMISISAGLVFLQILFISLLQVHFVLAGCRSEKRAQCESICIADGNKSWNCTLRAVIILPENTTYDVSLAKVSPVFALAEKKIQELQLLPPYIKFEWIFYDDKCDASYATISAMDGYGKNCAHVLFGPSCEYAIASVSRITKYFRSEGTPLITAGGSSYNFEDDKTSCTNEFYMLIRTGLLSFKTIGKFLLAMMKKFNWNDAVFFYERDGQSRVAGLHTCHLMMNSVAHIFREANVTYSSYTTDAGTGNLTEDMKREIGLNNAIVIMCANPQSIRQIMLVAEELNMVDSGEYVFFNIELFSSISQITEQPWYDKNDTEETNARAKKAYTALLTVTSKQPDDPEYVAFSEQVKEIAETKYNYKFEKDEPVSTFVTAFYDAVLLYAHALNDSINRNPDVLKRPFNGTEMVELMWNRTFHGITGNVTIDKNGDRISAYSLLDMNPETGRFEIVAHYFYNHLEYVAGKGIHWAGGRLEPPPDKPQCGFDGSLCPDNSLPGYAILSLVLGLTVILMAIISFLGYRHYKSEAEINSMVWRINWSDILPCEANAKFRGSMHSLAKRGSQLTVYSEDMVSLPGDRQIFIPVGFYRGCKIAIKKISDKNICLNRSLMLELKHMKDIQHDHLVKFYGACVDPPKCCIITEYCPKGSLQDILENEQIQLDWMFKLSLMHDIVRGMHFLHNSDIKTHGNLKSSNCVVDSRFVLKITDFGLHQLRKSSIEDDVENCNSYAYWRRLLWTAPELLRIDNPPPEGTQKGDVYSFGIIVNEITTRQGPFYLGIEDKSPKEIIELVKAYPKGLSQPFRPQVDETAFDDINNIMVKCWAEDPCERPDFGFLKTTIRKINKDNETGNIVDNLLQRMEQYANNLEGLVEERTRDYLEEKKKCEKLLYQLLPESVAAQLICGKPVIAETYDQVTIYFSDIVGFTALSAESTPMQVVSFLNDLYTCFDSIVENYDVYKVETIGDAYMVVSGLPMRNGNLHAREISRMALALLDAVRKFKIRHRPNDQLKLRIGLHSGPCVAGVVGRKMPRYCLFGDTVNTASRMESNGEALKIHVSQSTKEFLDQFGTFIITQRGYVAMKGKGQMLTYWLEGEREPSNPNFTTNSTTTPTTTNSNPTINNSFMELDSSKLSSSNCDLKTDQQQQQPQQPCYEDKNSTNHDVVDDDERTILTGNGNPPNMMPNSSCSNPSTCNNNGNSNHNHDLLKRNSSNLSFNSLVKTNNLKNLKTKCNISEDNVKSVTQPLLAKINS